MFRESDQALEVNMARRAATAKSAGPGATLKTYVSSDQRRPQILQAAAELFARRGFAGTTTRQIAAAVGTSETVLFRLFPTKEGLYAAILEQCVPVADVDRWLAQLRVLADRRDDEALFATVVQAIIESYRASPAYHRLMLFAALEDHALARIAQVKYSAPVAGFLREYVSRRQAEGAFKRFRPEVVVHMLVSIAGHYALWNSLGVNPLGLTDEEVARQAVALVAALRSEP